MANARRFGVTMWNVVQYVDANPGCTRCDIERHIMRLRGDGHIEKFPNITLTKLCNSVKQKSPRGIMRYTYTLNELGKELRDMPRPDVRKMTENSGRRKSHPSDWASEEIENELLIFRSHCRRWKTFYAWSSTTGKGITIPTDQVFMYAGRDRSFTQTLERGSGWANPIFNQGDVLVICEDGITVPIEARHLMPLNRRKRVISSKYTINEKE